MNLKFNVGVEKNTGVSFSKEHLVADKFNQWIIKKGEDINHEKIINKIEEFLYMPKNQSLSKGIKSEDVVAELKKMGVLSEIKTSTKTELFKTESEKLPGLKEVQDENLKKLLEENKFFEELEKNIFKNDKGLDDVLEKSLSLGRENFNEDTSNIEYYNQFVDLVKGGKKEIEFDFKELTEIEKIFEKEKDAWGDKDLNKKEKSKKVATIVERAVAYGISSLGWYGDGISMEPTSRFDDVKRRTDGVLEVTKNEDESNFMGLGVDVTYRGLLSESYRDKFFGLLQSIQDGYKTKIKYFKNHEGKRMKEFDVPKIILFFNVDDVKDLVHMIKNIDDPKIKEEFKNSPQKFTVMNQMMIQCEMLSDFAEESRNNIFKKYVEVVSSIKELAWDNPDIKKILDERHEDEVSKHMKYLINEFKKRK